jgi:capsular polysaccharide transport system permease protein
MMVRAHPAVSLPPREAAEPQLLATATPAQVTRLVYPRPIRAPAARFVLWRQRLRLLSFLLVAVMPVALASVYFFAIAADQYVAEFRMTLRRGDLPVTPISLFGGDPGYATAATESQIVAQFIASRAIVDELDPGLNLHQIFSTSSADWWARLPDPVSIERFVRYWQGQVDPFYDPTSGTIIVRLRAFTPQDALRVAQAVVAASERLVNDLSARARRDAVGHAEAEVQASEARLTAALDKVRDFRNQAGLIDPGKTADATAQLATKLREDLLKANSQLATLKSVVHDDTPLIRVLKARIHALEAQQKDLAHEMTTTGGPTPAPVLSQTLGSYEELQAEQKFAEAAYQHALEALDRARDSAERQQLYVASFVPPSLPEEALYPRRWRSIGVVILVAFAAWAIGGLAVQSIREHF